MRNNIVPTDISFSREYYGLNNTTDIYKGTSFKFPGKWAANTHYFNDEYIIDFVSYGGALWACQRSHISEYGDPPSETNVHWTKVMTGEKGEVYVPHFDPSTGMLSFELEGEPSGPINIASLKGDPGEDGVDGRDGTNGTNGVNGRTYRPSSELDEGCIVFRAEDGDVVRVNINSLRGPAGRNGEKGNPGKDWIFSKATVTSVDSWERPAVNIKADRPSDPNTTYTLELWIPKGEKGERGFQGFKGDKGDKGNDAPLNEFKIEFDAELGMSKLYSRPITTPFESEWTYIGICGGLPGKSPKLIRVFDEENDPLHQNNTRRDDRILWGYDGVPVSEWSLLCNLDELRGDENVHIGCEEPKMPDGVTPNYDQMWYDPCDDDEGHWNSAEFLADVCDEVGGTLANVGSIVGSESIRLVTESPSTDTKNFPRTSIHTVVDRNDKVLSITSNGLKTELSFGYSKTEGLKLLGKNNETIATLPVEDFIKDGMLQDVQVSENNLVFIFNTDAGSKQISVPLDKFIDTYLASLEGYGIEINKKIINIKINPTSEKYLTVDKDGLLLSGVKNDIDTKTTPEEVEQQILSKHYITLEEVPYINIRRNNRDRTAVKNIVQSDRDNWELERIEVPVGPDCTPLKNIPNGNIGTGTVNVGDKSDYHSYAYADHQHPTDFDLNGNADTATKLKTPVTISLEGAVTGNEDFDGSSSINISTTVNNIDASAIKTGTIDIDRLPKGALERMVIVADEAARFSLTTDEVQEGETVKQNDTGILYFVVDTTNLNNANGYVEYTSGSAASVPWSGVTDKPTFATVATSGSYRDLIDKPTIPLVGYSENATNLALRLAEGDRGYVTLTKNSIVSALGYTPSDSTEALIKGTNTVDNIPIIINTGSTGDAQLKINTTNNESCVLRLATLDQGVFDLRTSNTRSTIGRQNGPILEFVGQHINRGIETKTIPIAGDLVVEVVAEIPSSLTAGKCYVCTNTSSTTITSFSYDTTTDQLSDLMCMIIVAPGVELTFPENFYKNINIDDKSTSGYHVYCIQALNGPNIILANGATYIN